jgi:hypothetical protein
VEGELRPDSSSLHASVASGRDLTIMSFAAKNPLAVLGAAARGTTVAESMSTRYHMVSRVWKRGAAPARLALASVAQTTATTRPTGFAFTAGIVERRARSRLAPRSISLDSGAASISRVAAALTDRPAQSEPVWLSLSEAADYVRVSPRTRLGSHVSDTGRLLARIGRVTDHAAHREQSLNGLAATATNHCLTGCVLGEVTGMVIATALGWGNGASIALAIFFAFVFGYTLTSIPLYRSGLTVREIIPIALAADTVSILIMEAVDNGFIVLVPGALEAGLGDLLFWVTLLGGFAIAWPFAFAVNRRLIRRGKGHAVVHEYH